MLTGPAQQFRASRLVNQIFNLFLGREQALKCLPAPFAGEVGADFLSMIRLDELLRTSPGPVATETDVIESELFKTLGDDA